MYVLHEGDLRSSAQPTRVAGGYRCADAKSVVSAPVRSVRCCARSGRLPPSEVPAVWANGHARHGRAGSADTESKCQQARARRNEQARQGGHSSNSRQYHDVSHPPSHPPRSHPPPSIYPGGLVFYGGRCSDVRQRIHKQARGLLPGARRRRKHRRVSSSLRRHRKLPRDSGGRGVHVMQMLTDSTSGRDAMTYGSSSSVFTCLTQHSDTAPR